MVPTFEHGQDVLHHARALVLGDGRCALAVVTQTAGGSVRAPGAMMAVGLDGTRYGYLSGGCIDADAAVEAVQALERGEVRHRRYGAGSTTRDLALPCGGAIDVRFVPVTDLVAIDEALIALSQRRSVNFDVDAGFVIGRGPYLIRPKIRLRLAGRGADLLALAQLGTAAGFDMKIWTPSETDMADLAAHGHRAVHLTTPSHVPDVKDDPHTAFVLLFHDPDWEIPLLQQALAQDAFYIGAVGAARAQIVRRDALIQAGATQVARVRGPVGLVPSLRNASELAISILAEIIDAYPPPHEVTS